jgi:hypothetical protein
MIGTKLTITKSAYAICLAFYTAMAPSPCCAKLPPDPDNAALLYYQAFLLSPKPDPLIQASLDRMSYGGEVDKQVQEYVQRCRDTIRYAEKASCIPNCDWGPWYSLGFGFRVPHLEAVRLLSSVLHADARILAVRADYRAAFERCLAMRRLASHVGDQTVQFYALAVGTEDEVQRCICQILGSMPPDVETIRWLKGRLADVPPPLPSPARALRTDLDLALQTARTHDRMMAEVRQRIAGAADKEDTRRVQSLSDEELLAYMRKPYASFLDSALGIINSDMLYEKAYPAIQKLVRDLGEKVNSDPIGKIVAENITWMAEIVPRFYTTQVLSATRFNAFSVALELYLERAETGRLPEKLRGSYPKDIYSGRDFIYVVTGSKFLLRSWVQPADTRKPVELECRFQ